MDGLIKWEPFKEMSEMRSLFDRLVGRDWDLGKPIFGRGELRAWSPAIEILDQKNKLLVKAELPGLEKKDIKVNVDNDVLSISGEVKKEEETKEKGYYYSERAYGKFYRSITLPVSVQKNKIKASYKEGLLMVELPKAEETKSKETEIPIE